FAVERVQGAAPSIAKALAVGRRIGERKRALVLASGPDENPRFDPATPVFNNGVAHADGRKLTLIFDARLLPGHDPEAIFATLVQEGEAMAAEAGLRVEIEKNRANFAMELRPDSPLRDAAMEASRQLGLDPEPQAKP